MKRLILLAAALCLLAAPASAQPAAEAAPLTGQLCLPDGADAQSAAYVFSYSYPQFAVDMPGDGQINACYQALAADARGAAAAAANALDPLPQPGEPQWYTRIGYCVTLRDDDYVSVLLTSAQFLGNAETERLTANVFARSGVYAGQLLSLSQAMGLEEAEGAAGQAESYAAGLVYALVWSIVDGERAMQARAYYPDLTAADLREAFSPESDFYLDEDGNFVFYVQPGELASEVEGALTYPFSLAELLTAAR